MKIPKIVFGFGNLSDSKLLQRMLFVHEQMSSRSAIFPAPVPSMAAYLETCTEYQASITAAEAGGTLLKKLRKVAREKAILQYASLSYYVLIVAGDNEMIVAESGFPQAGPAQSRILTKPENVKILNGIVSGTLDLSVKKVPAAVSYVFQYTTDPTLAEASWMPMNCSTTKCQLTGLTPGVTYYVRVAAVGTKGQELYSDVSSKVAW